MKISIVLRVKNEGRTLNEVLERVKSQDCHQEMELVLVDSGSTDNTLDISKKHGCRIFHIPPEDFSWGYALNYGAEKSTGDVIIYLSGHCIPVDDHWLSSLLAPLEDETTGGVYSRHVPRPEVDPFEAIELEYFWFPPSKTGTRISESFSNASCAVRKKTWENVRFDESLLSCEDGEWAWRAGNNGWKIVYQPESRVWHSHPPRIQNIYLRWFWRCYTAKKFMSFTREGSLAYLFFNLFRYSLLDLGYLGKVGMPSKFWKIPFYEIVRHSGGFLGARAAVKHMEFEKWGEVKVPKWMKPLRKIIEN